MKTKRKVSETCGDCGNEMTAEERESPWFSPYDEAVCSNCEYENYHFRCAICDEYETIERQHKILVVFEPDKVFRSEGMAPGFYKIAHLPYYTDAMISAWVHDDSVKLVAPLPEGAKSDFYPAGHLCRSCIKKYIHPTTSGGGK